jgi:hypothetical protein
MKIKVLSFIACAFFLLSCQKSAEVQIENTQLSANKSGEQLGLLAGCYTNPVQSVSGDPYCFKFNGKYYIYRPNNKKVECYESTDLITWTNFQVVYTHTSAVWAPEVHSINGSLYLYFAVPNLSVNNNRDIAVIKLLNPTTADTSTAANIIVNDSNINIDPSVYVEGSNAYLLWKHKMADGSITKVKIRELKWSNPREFATGSASSVLIVGNDNPFGAQNTEHPDIVMQEYTAGGVAKKRFFLFFNNNRGDTENYRIEYATASALMGPYTFKGVMVEKNIAKGIYAPGGHSIVRDGSNYRWLVYRTKEDRGENWLRQTCIDRLFVDATANTATCDPTMGSFASTYCPDPL